MKTHRSKSPRSSSRLAIDGGKPVRTKPFPKWPIFDHRERRMVLKVALWAGGVRGQACQEEALWLTQNVLLGSRADRDDIAEAVRKVQRTAHKG